MNEAQDWRAVYDFWFPPGLDDADPETHGRMFVRWFGGGANAELPPFAPVLDAARTGRLDHWLATPLGRLSLIVVLDQFPRGLFAGTPEAYAASSGRLRPRTAWVGGMGVLMHRRAFTTPPHPLRKGGSVLHGRAS